jgi:hypothetical protein
MNIKKTYYDAQMTRLYIDFKDKSNSEEWFKKIKDVWNNRSLVIIEGEKRELLEIYKEEYKDIKGDKKRIEEIYKKEYFYSPATE